MLIVSHCSLAFHEHYLEKIENNDLGEIKVFFDEDADYEYGEGAALAVQEMEYWLDTLPDPSSIDYRDLFEMEMDNGTWIPNKYIVIDTVAGVMSPFNCRALQVTGLLQKPEDRISPYLLLLKMFENLKPELLEYEFNEPLGNKSKII